MWFEILPAFLIVSAAIAAPHGLAYILNYLVVGNLYRRSMESPQLRLQYLRDRRLSGNPYKLNGLEKLPGDGSSEGGNGSGYGKGYGKGGTSEGEGLPDEECECECVCECEEE